MDPWYTCQPVGKHKLPSLWWLLCVLNLVFLNEKSTILFAFHELLYCILHWGVPESQIQQRTGHRFLEVLRKYERTSVSQHQAVSNMLLSSTDLTYSEQHLSSATSHAVTSQT